MIWMSPHRVRDPWRTIAMFVCLFLGVYACGFITQTATPTWHSSNILLGEITFGYVITCILWAIWPDISGRPFPRAIPIWLMAGLPAFLETIFWVGKFS